jgi:FkbM family methyltransferase
MNSARANPSLPRVALIDHTLSGNGTASGEVKANLLGAWDECHLLHVYGKRFGRIGAVHAAQGRQRRVSTKKGVARLLHQFQPECVIYRPVPDSPRLHMFAMNYLRRSAVPTIVWIMDDWPERLRYERHERLSRMEEDLRWLFSHAAARLCIGEAMKQAYEARYGYDFNTMANGVDLSQWVVGPTHRIGCFTVRYAGSLADNMTLASVHRVARVIDRLYNAGATIRFEINTRSVWAKRTRRIFAGLNSCTIANREMSPKEYRSFLQGADLLLIAYNFDARSKAYTRYSVANKLPECLAARRPLLVHGPLDVATVQLVAGELPEAVVDSEDEETLRAWLLSHLQSPQRREALANRCRAFAAKSFDLGERQHKLESIIRESSESPFDGFIRYFQRGDKATLDECALVDKLTTKESGRDHVMLDVGAHRGSSLRRFLDRGWRVIAFEPDVHNRQQLLRRFGDRQLLSVDARAVADEPGNADFYQSMASDGISSILPFHRSHQPAGSVRVTTVTEAALEYGLNNIDFIKIDVEGLDLDVLKGVPWKQVPPRFLVVEFEDAKTKLLGHTWRDIADYLVTKGYIVYVSEWYPIVEYGTQHEWRSLRCYPCELSDSSAWGNLIAFDCEIAPEKIASATQLSLQTHRWSYSWERPASKLLKWLRNQRRSTSATV